MKKTQKSSNFEKSEMGLPSNERIKELKIHTLSLKLLCQGFHYTATKIKDQIKLKADAKTDRRREGERMIKRER